VHIAYYITGHGYGHGVRTCAICNAFSAQVELSFRTNLPEPFFREELSREFNYVPGVFDCGCIQSDSVTVDIKKTLDTYRTIADNNARILENEIEWCKKNAVDVIVSDITPFAFEIANRARIPSVAIASFTWFDIYHEYIHHDTAFEPYLQHIRRQYEMASCCIEAAPACQMPYFGNRKQIAFVARKGTDRRNAIYERYAIDPSKYIGLIYVGTFGMERASWKRLEVFDNWEFLGVCPLDDTPRNYRKVDKKDFSYQDISASVDLMITKIGYGALSECFLNGTPLLYLPRTNFAEYPVLEKAVMEWGGGYRLSEADFMDLKWNEVLNDIENGKRVQPIHSDGAQVCAKSIEKVAR